MKVTYTTGGATPIKVAELSLENTGVNRFRASIPVQDSVGTVVSRTAEIEAASEKTKAGTVRIMLKCTIPYFPQTDGAGLAIFDSTRSPKSYTLHIVHTIPAVMANEALNNAYASQAAQVASIAAQIIALGTLTGVTKVENSKLVMRDVPLQAGAPSVDGVKSYPLTPYTNTGTGHIKEVTNVSSSILAGSFLGRALAGLMPIDINSDKTIAVGTQLDASLQ